MSLYSLIKIILKKIFGPLFNQSEEDKRTFFYLMMFSASIMFFVLFMIILESEPLWPPGVTLQMCFILFLINFMRYVYVLLRCKNRNDKGKM